MLNKQNVFDVFVATFGFDDSFAHRWHHLNRCHEVVTWSDFQLTGVPWQKLVSGISNLLNAFDTVSRCAEIVLVHS